MKNQLLIRCDDTLLEMVNDIQAAMLKKKLAASSRSDALRMMLLAGYEKLSKDKE